MMSITERLGQFGASILASDDCGAVLTYQQAATASAFWRGRLGCEQKSLVVLLVDNTCAHVEAYLGILGAGHAVMLVGHEISAAALENIIAVYEPEAVVGREGLPLKVERFPGGGHISHLTDVLLSTSGSTGTQKFVRFSQKQLAENAASIVKYLDLGSDERPIAHLPFHYSYGLSIIHSHIAVGATVLLTSKSIMESGFWARIEEDAATSLSGVPFHFETMLRMRAFRKPLSSLRTLTQAGGRLAPEAVEQIGHLASERGWRFVVMYGQTEAGPRISYLPPASCVAHPSSIGVAIPGTSISLVDQNGDPIVEDGEEGELLVVSPSVMLGYAERRADLALGDVNNGRLFTGDLATRDGQGLFYITGRKSRFIKLHGNRINLETIERRLASLGLDVVCVGEDDRLWVVNKGEVPAEQLRSVIAEEFSFPLRALNFARVEVLPRSSSNKIQYNELLKNLKEGAQ
ncbi:MAG: AMP-binding protein [Clostridia bacterium]|nr:AMP-binding protein [Clostridia bacterium]